MTCTEGRGAGGGEMNRGVEMNPEVVPFVQKEIIRQAGCFTVTLSKVFLVGSCNTVAASLFAVP